MQQRLLFPELVSDEDDPQRLLRQGAALVLSVSGGKDSDAMTHHLLQRRAAEGWTGPALLLHADLGRAEWDVTADYVRDLARRTGLPLHIVRWTHGDLIDRIWRRYHQNPNRPCWPSAQMRYCTSDLKTGPINRFLRQTFPKNATVICAMGLRAGESRARARRKVFTRRLAASAPTRHRHVFDWLPIHDWDTTRVWETIERAGGIAHEAYRYGNQRVSCALCVLASQNDLFNGIHHHPDLYREYCRIEAVSGWSFRPTLWLSDLAPELLPEETRAAVALHKANRS